MQLADFKLFRSEITLIFYFTSCFFCKKALVMHPKCVYNKSSTENWPCLFILPFLLNSVTILLCILLNFCKHFVIRRRTAYEHTV